MSLNGRTYKNHIDGYNQLDYITGKAKDSPRNEFWYVNDDGDVVAARWRDWKVVFLENRGQAFGVWREPFVELRVPLLFNLRRDPFERAQHNANIYNDWFLDRVFVIAPIQGLATQFLLTMKEFPPSQSPGSFNLSKIEEQLQARRRLALSPKRLRTEASHGKHPRRLARRGCPFSSAAAAPPRTRPASSKT